MTIGILLVTHPGIGSAMLETSRTLLKTCPMRIHCLDVPLDEDTDALLAKANEEIIELDEGEGVLVLTDAYGATPSNLACQLARTTHASVVAGLSLPMLLRVLNYSREDLESLARRAADGGRRGVHTVPAESGTNN